MNFIDICLQNKRKIYALWILILFITLGSVGNLIFLTKPAIDNSVGIWFMKDDPELKIYENFNKEFGEKEWTFLMLETDSIYNPIFLRDLDTITKSIEKVKHIRNVVSLTNIRDMSIGYDGNIVYTKIYPVAEAGGLIDSNAVDAFIKCVENDSLYENSLLHKNDSKHVAILFQNDNNINALEPYRIEMIDSVKSIVGRYSSIKDFSLTGTSVVNAELNRSSLRDVKIFYVLVSLFIVLFGYFMLRNGKDLIVMLTVVILSAFPPMALLLYLGIPFNMVTVMIPPVLISLSVCDVIHVINAFHYERKFAGANTAIKIAIHKIWMPCFWTSLITIIGFLSLSTSTVYPIWQLGVFGAFGIFLAWIVTMTLVPNLLLLLWPATASPELSVADGSKKVGLYSKRLLPVIDRFKWGWLSIAMLLLCSLFGISKLKVDTDYTTFFGNGTSINQSYKKVKEAKFGQNPISITAHLPNDNKLLTELNYKKLLDFENALKKDTSIIKLLSLSDIISKIDTVINPGNLAGLQAGQPQINHISPLSIVGETGNNDDISNFFNKETNSIQFIALAPYMSSLELADFKSRVYAAGKLLPAGVELNVTGTTVLWANMDKQISGTQLESIAIITLIFVILLPIIFKSLKFGIMGIVINSLPLALTFSFMGLFGIKINMATALIGAISIGSSIDSTIFFINRFRLGLQQNLSPKDAVDFAVVTVGDGIIMTSLIIAGGFFCMAVSNFLPTAHVGIFVTLSILFSLFFDIIINPIVLKLIVPKNKSATLNAR